MIKGQLPPSLRMKLGITQKDYITTVLSTPVSPSKEPLEMTCQEICRDLINYWPQKFPDKNWQYLSGGISSRLREMVKDGELEYGVKKGKNGGQSYRLKQTT